MQSIIIKRSEKFYLLIYTKWLKYSQGRIHLKNQADLLQNAKFCAYRLVHNYRICKWFKVWNSVRKNTPAESISLKRHEEKITENTALKRSISFHSKMFNHTPCLNKRYKLRCFTIKVWQMHRCLQFDEDKRTNHNEIKSLNYLNYNGNDTVRDSLKHYVTDSMFFFKEKLLAQYTVSYLLFWWQVLSDLTLAILHKLRTSLLL